LVDGIYSNANMRTSSGGSWMDPGFSNASANGTFFAEVGLKSGLHNFTLLDEAARTGEDVSDDMIFLQAVVVQAGDGNSRYASFDLATLLTESPIACEQHKRSQHVGG
jgi:hypothetical protein